jgi:PAS domain S-box-containing protein
MPAAGVRAATAASDPGYEEFFWLAFRKSKNPMWIRDLDRVMVEVNDAAVERFGYTRDELIGTRSEKIVAPSDRKRLESDWRALQRSGTFVGERELITASGRHVRVQLASRLALVGNRELALMVTIDVALQPLRRRTSDAPARKVDLTPRELEIVHHVAMGQRAHEIADELFIAPTTVQTHIRNAMAKVGARSQAQLVAFAFCHEMLDPELLAGVTDR